MNKQMSLSGLMDELSQARTKKKEFLEQMEKPIPWSKWAEEIRLCYYKEVRGNKPYDLELMLCPYVLQNLYTLSDEGSFREPEEVNCAQGAAVICQRNSPIVYP